MRVLKSIPELSALPGPVFLAIGVFDGVHLGHRAVISRMLSDARRENGSAAVVTFDPHPARVLRPEKAPRLLTATSHKIRLIEALGVETLLVIHFDPAFAATPPDEFIRRLHGACHPLREICVGHQWSFGKDRAGNLEMMKTWGDKLGFDEVGVPAVEVEGRVVSSTQIRAAVQAGDFRGAAKLLGRDYTILGTVVRGDRLGRKIGFPTANLSAHSEQFPPDGVYAIEAIVAGRTFGGVANIGVRPTTHREEGGGERLLEVHLFDFDAEIYGEEIEIAFREYLRSEQKFSGLEELSAQIGRDAEAARKALRIRGKR